MELLRKKTLSFLSVLLLILVLAACAPAGGESQSSDSPPGQEQNQEQPRTPAREQNLDPNKETLVYANLSPQWSGGYQVDWAAVEKFNAAHDDIQIEVRDYGCTEYSEIPQSCSRLLTELAAGQVPDIIEVGYLPYYQLVRKGYLEDLWPYIENDPDLGQGNVMEAPLNAAEVDGNLYMVFGHVTIDTLTGAASVVGDRTSWTLKELQDTFATMPEGSTILANKEYRESVASALLGMCADSYVDWETGTCSFDSPDFRAALEFIGTFPGWDDVRDYHQNISVEAYQTEIDEQIKNGCQMLEIGQIQSMGDILRLDLRYGGQCAFVGYPTEDGSVGSCFRPAGHRLAMSASCKDKKAAWEFIRTVLLPSHNPMEYRSLIPVSRVDYESAKSIFMQEEQMLHPFYPTTGAVLAPPMSEEQFQRFDSFFNSVDKIHLNDTTLSDLIMDACGPYFAGDKTLDETVRQIQNRVSLYVNEAR